MPQRLLCLVVTIFCLGIASNSFAMLMDESDSGKCSGMHCEQTTTHTEEWVTYETQEYTYEYEEHWEVSFEEILSYVPYRPRRNNCMNSTQYDHLYDMTVSGENTTYYINTIDGSLMIGDKVVNRCGNGRRRPHGGHFELSGHWVYSLSIYEHAVWTTVTSGYWSITDTITWTCWPPHIPPCPPPPPVGPVPEPASMILFGTGIAGLAITHKKRRLKK